MPREPAGDARGETRRPSASAKPAVGKTLPARVRRRAAHELSCAAPATAPEIVEWRAFFGRRCEQSGALATYYFPSHFELRGIKIPSHRFSAIKYGSYCFKECVGPVAPELSVSSFSTRNITCGTGAGENDRQQIKPVTVKKISQTSLGVFIIKNANVA